MTPFIIHDGCSIFVHIIFEFFEFFMICFVDPLNHPRDDILSSTPSINVISNRGSMVGHK